MELKVGDLRNFSFFPDKHFKIHEILDNPNIEMEWTWNSGLCPHCKNKIERIVKHKFYRIEILTDTEKNDNDLTRNNIVLLGDTFDKRRMVLTNEKYDEVFSKSKNFKKFISEVK